MVKKTIKLLVELGVFSIILIIGTFIFFNSDSVSLEKILSFSEGNMYLSLLIFYIGFMILALLGISVSPLILLASFLFEPLIAIIIAFISLYSTSIIAFRITDFVSHKFIKKNHPTYKIKFHIVEKVVEKISSTIEKNCFKTVFLSKFFIANVIVSYALGLISERVDKVKFYSATFLNNLIYTVVLITLGNIFTENIPLFISLLCLIIAYYAIRFLYRRVHLKKSH